MFGYCGPSPPTAQVYSARLRLSTSKPLAEQMAIVDDVTDVLQLRHCQHQVVGSVERRGISGGQRKRVNIGWDTCLGLPLCCRDSLPG